MLGEMTWEQEQLTDPYTGEVLEFHPLERAVVETPYREDLPVEDPRLSAAHWRSKGLGPKEAVEAARVYAAFRGPLLRGRKLERMILEDFENGCRLLELSRQMEQLAREPVAASLDLDGQVEPAKDGKVPEVPEHAERARRVAVLGEDAESIPREVPEELERWWSRVREQLEPLPDSPSAHGTFRREVRRNRLRLAWLDLLEALSSGREHLSRLTKRVLGVEGLRNGKLTVRLRANGKVLRKEVGPALWLRTMRRPLWVRFLRSALRRDPGRARDLLGRLLDRELGREQVLAQVKLPPVVIPGPVQRRRRSFRLLDRKVRERRKDEALGVARELWLRGERKKARQWLRAAGFRLARGFRFVFLPPEFPELGLELPPANGSTEKALRTVFNRLLAVSNWEEPRLTLRQKLWLWRKWWPRVKRHYATEN